VYPIVKKIKLKQTSNLEDMETTLMRKVRGRFYTIIQINFVVYFPVLSPKYYEIESIDASD